MKLSVIDYRAADSAKQFVDSLRNTGFAVLKNHPINQQLVDRIYQDWQAFFDGENKLEYLFNPETQDGFFPAEVSETAKGHTVKDIKEYFHVYPWGRIPDSLRQDILAYYANANTLATELLDWVDQECPEEVMTGFSMPLPEMILDSQKTLLRVLHYPPLSGKEEIGAVRAAAHEDINLLTILPAANKPGLEVKTRDGQWLEVPCDFGNLIINSGDMLKEASAGYFPSTTHRVVNPKGADIGKSRLSLPLFLHPNPNVVLSERHTASSYLQERLRELGVI
ncbi:isopenicillin N synthase family oxygenase [Shewanella submarina]|uniref:2-oxoglutarate-dependent ethylene/succinate-forming enzyme n=1 Tax=Shewanella submarina TaxID=2016376 RepID=A0ABV7GJN8_9GAMM|nr:2OG-Fe(II) oxygenase family protein [Shewanella submarina]MCL1039037.1 isopenicillin N synthase family oxygenase [Shewanella submarina]